MRSTERLTVNANAEKTLRHFQEGGASRVIGHFHGEASAPPPMPAGADGKHVDVEKKRENKRDSVAEAETL